jgi:flagellar biosynthesis/type III secretory pathway M-ring protein FliF/YscJ
MPIDLLAAAAGGGAFFVLFMSFMAGRGRRKRRKLEAELGHVPAAGPKAKRGKKGAVPQAAPELAPRVGAPSRPTDPDRQAVDEIKADLERMVAESPESLAALLSGWMAK